MSQEPQVPFEPFPSEEARFDFLTNTANDIKSAVDNQDRLTLTGLRHQLHIKLESKHIGPMEYLLVAFPSQPFMDEADKRTYLTAVSKFIGDTAGTSQYETTHQIRSEIITRTIEQWITTDEAISASLGLYMPPRNA